MDRVNFLIILKYLVFIFFIWIYHTYNDVIPFAKSLENIYKQDKILNINIIRLLAKHDIKRELEHKRLREKLPDRRTYKSERNVYDNLSAYYVVKSKVSNNLDLYMKNYKNRYRRKKGLSKLDCYCENKVFSKFNNICDIGEKMMYDEKRANKFFLKKYGVGLIFFSLIPALGFIFPILFGVQDIGRGILSYCLSENHLEDTNHGNCTSTYKWHEHKTTIEIIGYFSYIFFSFFGVIVSLAFIYIFIKVIKYERLKAGKGKMNIKEYCRFCKDIF
ncbi:Plasmodium exported protein, unknown function [Plasmodium vivax]|uniref:Variable surface protein Vir35 n=1 Tax=Plasmodium vivax TaxID=5855 RepID=A0A565A3Y2_PLAVI|nr:Plasmodium exported protein, unknown function [Plasmodium vivax]